jgi:DNA-binding beta-propeller fold protein YncE
MRRTLSTCAAIAALVAAAAAQAPKLEVEPLWPKPFPVAKHWILGSVTGVATDAQDHIWVVHRGVDSLQNNEKGPTLEPWASQCCFAAPQVLEFDANGTLVASWDVGANKGYDWPHDPSGIAVDSKGNVWIGSGLAPTAAGPADAQVLKFDKTGKFVSQIGKAGQTDAGSTNVSRPLAIAIDDAANELYVADDGHGRIAVFDANSGAFKREWKANGAAFKTIACVKLAKDGMVYVCDRGNNRIQVFQKDGKFVKDAFVSKTTTGDGSVWDLAWSPDQRNLYVADGHDKKVWILDAKSLETVGSVGQGGRYPGEFYGVGSIAVDSKGNVYTGETYEGKRVQKFVKR